MFIERLNDYTINKFRLSLPLTVDGKPVPVRVYCADRFYDDPRGTTPYIMFLKDFSCRISHSDERVKQELNRQYIRFMRETFGEEYDNALSVHIFKKCEEEKAANLDL